jgi:hypothetical protein
VISFDADPRTRLVACGTLLFLAGLIVTPALGRWWVAFLIVVPAILGYLAARLDWPLHAAGLVLTPAIITALLSLYGGGSGATDVAWLGLLLLPFAGLAVLAGGFAGAWIGVKTHGGDWPVPPLHPDQVRRGWIGAGVMLAALLVVDPLLCGTAGMDREACRNAAVAVMLAVAVLGAVVFREWLWAAMAAVGVTVWVAAGSVLHGGPAPLDLLVGGLGWLFAMAALAWIKFAAEAAAWLQLRSGRRAR